MTKVNSKFKIVWAGIFVFFSMHGHAQYSEDDIIRRIESYQITNDSFYDAGLFPSQRSWFFFSKPVEDNTLFFTVSIASTLQMIRAELDPKNKEAANLIIEKTRDVYSKYQSRNGEVSFNFWQTALPDLPFPNGNRFISNENARLPDDFDTTVLTALANGQDDSLDVLIRRKIIAYSGRSDRDKVDLITPKEYRNANAYEVWFGKNMPQTFDVCVMSNVLLYVFDREFALTNYDEATIQLILDMIQNKDHLNRISEISHQSNSPALALYHVARVIAADKQEHFDTVKDAVVEDLWSLLETESNEVAKVMVISSLLRLGTAPKVSINIEEFEEDAKEFEFFSLDPGALGIGGFFPTFRWVCEAYNWTLLLEMTALEKRAATR